MKGKYTGESVMLSVDVLHRHPQNPRKGIGNVEELADSIKKNGVMQNLTVIPGYWDSNGNHHDEEYTLLIGHRRFTAAKLAGVTELPCRIIEGMTEKEQIATMLEENMQRTDLTIWEQASSFQLMLDLGETEDTIAQKTGFSKQTIKHRLNIAKLDEKELKSKEKTFQLSLKDLYELEKIKDVETRNRVLKEANDSRDLVWRAHRAAADEIENEKYEALINIFKEIGLKEAPKKVIESGAYNSEWKHLIDFDLRNEKTELRIPPAVQADITDKCFYARWKYRSEVSIIAPNKRAINKKTKEELEAQQKKKRQKEYKDRYKGLVNRVHVFVREIIDGNIDDVKVSIDLVKELFDLVQNLNICIHNQLISFISGKESYSLDEDERKEAEEKAEKLSITHQMLIYIDTALKDKEPMFHNGTYNKESGACLMKVFETLSKWGWTFEKDQKSLIDGTCELFEKGGKK